MDEQLLMAKSNQDFLLTLNDDCFKDCVSSFAQDKLADSEIACVKNCTARTMQEATIMPQLLNELDNKYGDRF